jgi:hypothetical protein
VARSHSRYLPRPEILARAFAKQVLEYSTGGKIRFSDQTVLDRIVLKQASIAMGLPFLDAMNPAFGASNPTKPKRFVGVSLSLGLHNPFLVPKNSGASYTQQYSAFARRDR